MTESMHTLTLKTVANYRQAAERTVQAYRSGGHRLLALLGRGTGMVAERGRLAPRLVALLQRTSERFSDVAARGIDAVSDTGERLIDAGGSAVTAQVERLADIAGTVDARVLRGRLAATARFGLPGARFALKLSERLAAGAGTLADTAAGPLPSRAKTAVARGRRAAKGKTTTMMRRGVAKVADAADVAKAGTKAVGKKVQKRAAPVARQARAAVTTAAATVEKPGKAVEKVVEAAAAPKAKAVRRRAQATVVAAAPAADATA